MSLKYFINYDISGKILSYGYNEEEHIPENSIINDTNIGYNLHNFFVDTKTLNLVEIPQKPDRYSEFNWDTKQWQLGVDWNNKSKIDTLREINMLASQKIELVYPIYKQLNIESDFGKDSTEYQTMRTYINSIRSISNNASIQTQNSETLDEINTSFDNYKLELDAL